MIKAKKTSWEEKFDEQGLGCCAGDYCKGDHNGDIKAFIRQVRQEATRETIEAVEKELQDMEVDLVETTSQEYDNGWNECNLKWDLRIIDLEKCLAELKKKERIE